MLIIKFSRVALCFVYSIPIIVTLLTKLVFLNSIAKYYVVVFLLLFACMFFSFFVLFCFCLAFFLLLLVLLVCFLFSCCCFHPFSLHIAQVVL